MIQSCDGKLSVGRRYSFSFMCALAVGEDGTIPSSRTRLLCSANFVFKAPASYYMMSLKSKLTLSKQHFRITSKP